MFIFFIYYGYFLDYCKNIDFLIQRLYGSLILQKKEDLLSISRRQTCRRTFSTHKCPATDFYIEPNEDRKFILYKPKICEIIFKKSANIRQCSLEEGAVMCGISVPAEAAHWGQFSGYGRPLRPLRRRTLSCSCACVLVTLGRPKGML